MNYLECGSFAARFLAVAAWLLCLGSIAAVAEEPLRVDVFTSGADGYHAFRIPALLVTRAGTLLAFCEGRKTSRSDHGDIDLVLRRSTDGGRTWGPLELVHEEGGTEKVTIGNPCPVVDQSTGTIWLPFTRDNDKVLITHSTDDGRTWSPPRDITADVKLPKWGWYATGPGVGIQLLRGPHQGRLVIPCDHREPIPGHKAATVSHVFFSDDAGKSWKLGGSAEPHTNECQVVELSDGRLLLNMRNYWGRDAGLAERDKRRAVATSRDGGQSWSPLEFDTTLVEPVCQASLIALPADDGQRPLLVFSNPASPSKRHRLTVRRSEDEGRTWPQSRLLHEGPSAYSCLAALPDGRIGCLYEGGEKDTYDKIIFARFSQAWISE